MEGKYYIDIFARFGDTEPVKTLVFDNIKEAYKEAQSIWYKTYGKREGTMANFIQYVKQEYSSSCISFHLPNNGMCDFYFERV